MAASAGGRGSRMSTCARCRSTRPSSARARPRKLAPTTIARKLAAVRAFLRHALGPEHVPDASFAPRRPRRLPDAPRPHEVDAELEAFDGVRAARAEEPRAGRARLLSRTALAGGDRPRPRPTSTSSRSSCTCAARAARNGSCRSARRRRTRSRVYLRESRPQLARGAENALFLSARGRRLDTSTLAACFPTHTACGMPSPRTCSRAAPTCARSRSSWATARSRRRRCTATWTPAACARSTTARTRALEPLTGSPARSGCPPLPPSDTIRTKTSTCLSRVRAEKRAAPPRSGVRLACVHAGLLLKQRIRRANVPMGGPSMRGAARNLARPQV